jgi:hypothetical protein
MTEDAETERSAASELESQLKDQNIKCLASKQQIAAAETLIGWEDQSVEVLQGLMSEKVARVQQRRKLRESLIAAGNPKSSLVLY